MSGPLLVVERLSKSFGAVVALSALSCSVSAGERVAIIGPNGAGKTTLFNVLGGQLRADAGTASFAGQRITGLAPHAIARLGVGRTFQVAATFASMTVRENVQIALLARQGEQRSPWRQGSERHAPAAQALLDRMGIGALAARGCATLAYVDLKRVELAIALALQPQLLLMDEPTAGMAALERSRLMALVSTLAHSDGLALLFTEHDMDIVFAHADRILVLDRGRLIADGPPAAYARTPKCAPSTSARRHEAPPVACLRSARCAQGMAGRRHCTSSRSAWRTRKTWCCSGVMAPASRPRSRPLPACCGRCAVRCCFAGERIEALTSWRIARMGLGYVPEERRIFADLTVVENLQVGRQPARPGLPQWTFERVVALFPSLGELKDRRGGEISGGEQQMLTIARTLMGNPTTLLLDEPTEGLAPVIVAQVAEALRELKRDGVAVLLSEQNFRFAQEVADRAYVIEGGQLRYAGSMAAFVRDGAARAQYLGLD